MSSRNSSASERTPLLLQKALRHDSTPKVCTGAVITFIVLGILALTVINHFLGSGSVAFPKGWTVGQLLSKIVVPIYAVTSLTLIAFRVHCGRHLFKSMDAQKAQETTRSALALEVQDDDGASDTDSVQSESMDPLGQNNPESFPTVSELKSPLIPKTPDSERSSSPASSSTSVPASIETSAASSVTLSDTTDPLGLEALELTPATAPTVIGTDEEREAALVQIRGHLNRTVESRRLDINDLNQIRVLLNNPIFSCYMTVLESPKDPLAIEYALLLAWHEALQRNFDFAQRVIPRVISSKDDGNCLFTTAINARDPEQRGQDLAERAHQERVETVAWIQENIEDKAVQINLARSFAEHYDKKVTTLKQSLHDREVGRALSSISPTDPAYAAETARLHKELALMNQLLAKSYQALFQTIPFPQDMVEAYLAEISQSGVHAGAAEIHAISCRHRATIYIHYPGQRAATDIFNPQFARSGGGTYRFEYTGNHYNLQLSYADEDGL